MAGRGIEGRGGRRDNQGRAEEGTGLCRICPEAESGRCSVVIFGTNRPHCAFPSDDSLSRVTGLFVLFCGIGQAGGWEDCITSYAVASGGSSLQPRVRRQSKTC